MIKHRIRTWYFLLGRFLIHFSIWSKQKIVFRIGRLINLFGSLDLNRIWNMLIYISSNQNLSRFNGCEFHLKKKNKKQSKKRWKHVKWNKKTSKKNFLKEKTSKNFKNQIKAMQILSYFSKNMKNGFIRWNFGFWGVKSRKKFLLRESWSFFFFWFSGKVSE